jgi:hypothetical protein
MSFNVTAIQTTSYSAAYNDLVRVDPTSGAFTVTLPAASLAAGGTVAVKGVAGSANAVTVAPSGTDAIDGRASLQLYGRDSLELVSDGASNWMVIDAGDSLRGVYNVKIFGAIGDNIADDTAPIQNAIHAAASNGNGTVYVPAGTYRITSTLLFSKVLGLRFAGAGRNATTFVWAGGAAGTMMNVSGCARCRFASFQLDGSGDTTGMLFNGILGSPNVVSTLNCFDEVYFSTGFAYGVRMGTVAYENDQSTWFKCSFVSCSIAGVSIEDANAVIHNFYDCAFNFCDAGITALRGNGGSFNLFGCGFAGNGISNNAATSYDIAVYPSSRGTTVDGCWSEGSYRFLRTGAGSTAAQVTLTECSVNGIVDNTGAGNGLGIGIQWEATGGLNLFGGKYNGTYAAGPNAFQIQIGPNNNRRANVSIVGTTFAANPFQTTSCRLASISLTNVQMLLVMDPTAPATTGGFLQRGTQASPINFVAGNTMIYAPSAWLRIPRGTALSAGANVFTITSLNCQGSSEITVDAVKSYGGIAASNGVLITASDAGSSQLQVTITLETAFTLTSDLVLRVTVTPEICSVL